MLKYQILYLKMLQGIFCDKIFCDFCVIMKIMKIFNHRNLELQWNLCIMDTLGPTKGVLIFQVSLYDKAPFGTIVRCPDYAGVHIFMCPD